MENKAQTKTILIIEDDNSLCALITQILEHYGYCLLLSSSGQEAIKKLTEFNGCIDAMITEIHLPGIDSLQVEKEATFKHPHIRKLFLLNSSDDMDKFSASKTSAGRDFLQKPFTPSSLAAKIKILLDRSQLINV